MSFCTCRGGDKADREVPAGHRVALREGTLMGIRTAMRVPAFHFQEAQPRLQHLRHQTQAYVGGLGVPGVVFCSDLAHCKGLGCPWQW